MHFHESTVGFVCATVIDVVTAEKRKEIPSDSLLDMLIQVCETQRTNALGIRCYSKTRRVKKYESSY